MKIKIASLIKNNLSPLEIVYTHFTKVGSTLVPHIVRYGFDLKNFEDAKQMYYDLVFACAEEYQQNAKVELLKGQEIIGHEEFGDLKTGLNQQQSPFFN